MTGDHKDPAQQGYVNEDFALSHIPLIVQTVEIPGEVLGAKIARNAASRVYRNGRQCLSRSLCLSVCQLPPLAAGRIGQLGLTGRCAESPCG